MRSLFKKLIQWLLGERMRRALRKNNAAVILIIGKELRSVFRDEIFDYLNKLGFKCAVNSPGYNYKLGLPLTVLGFDSGYQSIYKWFFLLFKPYNLKSKIIITEFNFGDNFKSDLNYINSYINPKMVVVSDFNDEAQFGTSIDNFLSGFNENVSKIVPENLESKVSGIIKYKINPESDRVENKFGKHYVAAASAADLVASILNRDNVTEK